MKKILIIAYQFPPMAGAGVPRTVKFVKYLPELGWLPSVLTRDLKNLPLIDDTFFKDIPGEIDIHRTPAYDLTNLHGLIHIPGKVIARKILIPDSELLWQKGSRKLAVKLIKDNNFDYIYTTSAPYSSHLLGLFLKRQFSNIKWLADFRDEWTNNPYLLDNPHNFIRMKIEKRMEQNVLKGADALITNSSIMLNNFLSNNQAIDKLKNKFYVIPNGFDSSDFKKLVKNTTKNEKFTITYTGAFYGRRKPDLFLQSVSELVKSGLLDKDNIIIKFIGNFKIKVLENLINGLNLDNIVNIYPYMHHDEVINQLATSDCLLLIEGGGPGAEAFFTGKVFEYINISKPILAVIPINGMAANLLRETKTGIISDCDDKEKTKENILFLYNNYKNNIGSINPDWDKINKYERKTLTKQLVKILEEN